MDDRERGRSSRRDFLAGVAAVATMPTLGTPALGAQSGVTATYRIGLPLERQWSFGFADSEGIGSPAATVGTITDDVIYARLAPTNYDPAKIVARDRESHEQLWEATATRDVSAPAVVDDTLAVTTSDGIKAYPAGEQPNDPDWEREFEYDDVLSPTIFGETVCAAAYSIETERRTDGDRHHYRRGALFAYETDGTLKWSDSGPLMDAPYAWDDSLYHIVGEQYKQNGTNHVVSGRVVSRESETGEIEWETPEIDAQLLRLGIDREVVVASSPDGTLRGIDMDSGAIQWELEASPELGDFTVGPDHVFHGDGTAIRAVTPTTGTAAWSRTDLEEPYDLLYSDDLLFVGSVGGEFYALDAATGETVWSESHFGSDGYVRIRDGVVYTIADNWIGAYIGQRGRALQRLEDVRSAGLLGSITHPIANLFGRDEALARAEDAIADQRYEDAIAAIDSAQLRERAAGLGVTAVTGGSAYGGGRVAAKTYRQRQVESGLEAIRTAYPIASGALEGLNPATVIRDAEAALDGAQSRLGPTLRETVRRDDEYARLLDRLERFEATSDELAAVSVELAEHGERLETDAWRGAFADCFETGDGDALETTLEACRTAIDLTTKYERVRPAADASGFDVCEFEAVLSAVQTPSSQSDETTVEYCRAALEALSAYTSAKDVLEEYDLSAVQGTIESAIPADPSHRGPAGDSLGDVRDLLATAIDANSKRRALDLRHSDLDQTDLQQWIQAALYEVSLEELGDVRDAIDNLATGIWHVDHLQAYSPTAFEHLIADLYADAGYRTEVSQRSNDRGIDVVATDGTETLAIQVKQYSPGNRVGRPTVQQTAGAREQVGANRAVIVCSSSFTDAAKAASRDYGETVELVDGATLTRRLSRSSLTPPTGVRSRAGRGQQRQQQRRQSSSGSGRRDVGGAGPGTGGTFCMLCGEQFRGDLEEVRTPDGETIRCCPRCEQLIDDATGDGPADRAAAADVLGVDPTASRDEIKAAYRTRVREAHPDQGGSQEEFQRVQEAYERLS